MPVVSVDAAAGGACFAMRARRTESLGMDVSMIATLMTGSLNRLIVLSTFLVTVLPVGLLAAWWVFAAGAGEAPKNDPRSNRALTEARAVGNALDLWMTHAESELRSWGEAPALINGVRRAAVEHHERGYTEQTPEKVNAQLVHDRHLGLAPEADEYLAVQVGKSKAWTQAHYSDEYGFTVGVAGLEEDFVQTDENWWQAAWNRGRHEGNISFDENTSGFAFRIALRMDDPATKAAVGVIDGSIALTAIHRLADGFAAESSSVRILDEKGQLIADTASGHARDRIMRLSRDAMNSEGWRQGVGAPGNAGGSGEDGIERGWVRLAEASGPHRDWIVIVDRPVGGMANRGGDPAALAVALGGALALWLFSSLWLIRRTGSRLRLLVEHVEEWNLGRISREVDDPGNDEIGRLAQNLETIRGTIRQAAQILANERRERPDRPGGDGAA